MNQVAIIFGRFNPPHKGHKNAWQVASKFPHWFIGTNQSTVGPKDPLPFEVKVQCMETIMPAARGHIIADTSWLTMAATVYKQHGKIDLVCCTDEAWVVPALQKYNGVEGAHGMYHFNVIHHKATPRLASATDLRAAVERDDPVAFAQAAGVPADTPVAGHSFFKLVQHYLMPYVEKAAAKQLNTKVPKEKVMKKGPAKQLAENRHGYDDSGMSLAPGNDEGEDSWDYSAAHDRIGAGDPRRHRQHQADVPHDVHINGRKWKTFGSHSHASNVAKKIKGATVHRSMEESKTIETEAVEQRLDPKCWKGKHKEGTKIKGGVRVNNCVPNEGRIRIGQALEEVWQQKFNK